MENACCSRVLRIQSKMETKQARDVSPTQWPRLCRWGWRKEKDHGKSIRRHTMIFILKTGLSGPVRPAGLLGRIGAGGL